MSPGRFIDEYYDEDDEDEDYEDPNGCLVLVLVLLLSVAVIGALILLFVRPHLW